MHPAAVLVAASFSGQPQPSVFAVEVKNHNRCLVVNQTQHKKLRKMRLSCSLLPSYDVQSPVKVMSRNVQRRSILSFADVDGKTDVAAHMRQQRIEGNFCDSRLGTGRKPRRVHTQSVIQHGAPNLADEHTGVLNVVYVG